MGAESLVAYSIVVLFQILVDGWLTKLSAPIVVYDPRRFSGIRAPFDIPVEDFLFGFALIALTIILWERAGQREVAGRGPGLAGGGPKNRTGTAPKLPR